MESVMTRWMIIFLAMIAVLRGSIVPVSAVETAPRISDREIIESLATLKQGQVDINKRIDDVNQRIAGLQNTTLVLFGAIITLMVALFGYIAWDRRTALRPLQERLQGMERDIESHYDYASRLAHIEQVLRELAKTDQKVAAALRSVSLL